MYYQNVLPWKTPEKYCWKHCNSDEIFTEKWCSKCENKKWYKVDTSTAKYHENYIQCTELCPTDKWLAFSDNKSYCKDQNWNTQSFCCVSLYSDMVNSCDIEHGCWLFDKEDWTKWCGCPPDMTWIN